MNLLFPWLIGEVRTQAETKYTPKAKPQSDHYDYLVARGDMLVAIVTNPVHSILPELLDPKLIACLDTKKTS